MTQKIADLSVWHGNELIDRPDWLINLNSDDVDEIRSAVRETAESNIDDIHERTFPLSGLRAKLLAVQDSLEYRSAATLIRGFPIHEFDENQLTRAFIGIASYVGTPMSQSATGECIFHVRDAGFAENDPRARGPNTKKKLSFHTDRCDVIGFMCVNQAKTGGENFLVSSTAIYNEIAENYPALLSELMQPFYYKRHNVDAGNEHSFCRQPVFSFCEGRFACSFLRVLIDRAYRSGEVPEMTSSQRDALDILESLCEQEKFQYRFYQQPGDILFLNNWTTLHRRAEFVDHDEPEMKRHLLRIWLSVPNSRPIDPLFKENFGATQAGAIRGGMRVNTPSPGSSTTAQS